MTATEDSLILRAFRAEDAPAVAAWFEGDGLSLPVKGTSWASRLVSDPRIVAFVAEERGEPVGLVRLDCAPDGLAELTMVVRPGCRRRGRGHRIFALLLPQVRDLGVRGLVAFVAIHNALALQFFGRVGFRAGARVGERLRLQRLVHTGGPSTQPLDIGV